MTDAYYKDILALELLISAVGEPPAGSDAAKYLSNLQTNLGTTKSQANVIDAKVTLTQKAYHALEEDRKIQGEFSADMQKKLNGLRAANRGQERHLLHQMLLLNEDGDLNGANATNGHRKLIKGIRQSLGTGKGGRDALVLAVASTAAETGDAAFAFGEKLKEKDPSVAGKYLLASAIDALLPIARTNGLSADSIAVIEALREEIKAVGGGSPGSGYWPSGYVYSSSSSSTTPP